MRPLFILLLAASLGAHATQPIHILPEPVSVQLRPGEFKWSGGMVWYGTDSAVLRDSPGLIHSNDSTSAKVIVSFGAIPGTQGNEGYILDITPKKIRITASGAAGLFYALQSLGQLLPGGTPTGASIPCAYIVDYPRYAYRGMHLDVSRHFFDVTFIKHYLDLLAENKINVFHWHITDSHGWRLEIKKYPKLTSVGAWRADRTGIPMTLAQPTAAGELPTYGGFYTQEQVKEIVQYAAKKFITIIPEIEMPGHCEAALVSYPQLQDLGNPIPLLMPTGYAGDLKHNFCIGYDSTYIFLQDVLDEVMKLFPSKYIHIGGDEVRGEPWLGCPRCRKLGLKTSRELQAYFTHRIDSFVNSRGRKIIGWDEILEAQLQPGGAVMSWHGDVGVRAGAAKGLDVVMAPYHNTYFDFYQSAPALEPDITYAGLPLDTVYAFEPVPAGVSAAEAAHIIGGEACLWTENIPTPERVEYMLLPRLLALAEVLWTPRDRKDYVRFVSRVEEQFHRWNLQEVNYAKSIYNVAIRPSFDSTHDRIKITLDAQAPSHGIHYTLDGTDPVSTSPLYSKPLQIGRGHSTVLHTALFEGNRRLGKVNVDSFRLQPTAHIEDYPNLLDGIFGTIEPYDGRWVSFSDSIEVLTVDLGAARPVHSVAVRFMEDSVGLIFVPKKITIEGSVDGETFTPIKNIVNQKVPQQDERHVVKYNASLTGRPVRFIRLRLQSAPRFSAKEKNMIFLDEIVIQ